MTTGEPSPSADRGTLAYALRLQQAGRFVEAEAAYAAHLATHPADPKALAAAGAAALEAGRPVLAAERFEKWAALFPASAEARCSLGQALSRAGRVQDAIFHLERCVQLDPAHAAAHHHLGIALERVGDRSDAIIAFERALVLDPKRADAAAHLGAVFNRRGETARARAAFGRALAIEPSLVAARSGQALAEAIEGNLDGARDALEAMRAENPDAAVYWRTLGRILSWSGDLGAAEAAYRRASTLDPDDSDARTGVATSLLALGNYAAGFRAYEERPDGRYGRARRFPQIPVWSGARLDGMLLVLCEGTLSDVVQYVRFLPDARSRVREVALVADGYWAPLAPLLATVAGCDHLLKDTTRVDRLEAIPMARVSLPSLAFHQAVTPATLPGPIPYLAAPASRVAQWRPRLVALPSPRIGLVWAARGDRGTLSRHKSVPPALVSPLLALPGAAFVSLQVGALGNRAPFGALADRIIDFATEIRDFGDTAAIIGELDLVISVDTAVAHVAGAMGKPVWLLDRYHTSWPWRLDAERSRWYPSLRIFRQQRFLEWSRPMAAVLAALGQFVADGTS
jgi:tetratricopeptide (TPR) repeat protein